VANKRSPNRLSGRLVHWSVKNGNTSVHFPITPYFVRHMAHCQTQGWYDLVMDALSCTECRAIYLDHQNPPYRPERGSSDRGVNGRASGVCQYRDAKQEDLSEGPRFDRDVVTITQCEATPNGSPCDVDFGAEPEGAVASAAKGFGNGAAAIIPDLQQSVACESHSDDSERLTGAALELDGVAARKIDVAPAAVRVVTH